jgi:hypothetical protein
MAFDPHPYPSPRQHLVVRLVLLTCLLALIALLSGCGTVPSTSSAPALPPVHLTASCPAPPSLHSGQSEAVLLNHLTTMWLLTDCARRHQDLVRWTESQARPPPR